MIEDGSNITPGEYRGKVMIFMTYSTPFVLTKKYTTEAENLFIMKQNKYPNLKVYKIDVSVMEEHKDEMVRISGKKVLPQIFINVGGATSWNGNFPELQDLEEDELLDNMLQNIGS